MNRHMPGCSFVRCPEQERVAGVQNCSLVTVTHKSHNIRD